MEPVLAAERGMNDNGNRYALAALKERRSVIDGELRECRRRVRYLQEALGHLDATLSLFDPDGNPKAIRPKRPRRVNHFGAGHLSRLLLDVIRKAERPLSSQEIVGTIVAQLGYGPEAARDMGIRIRSSLAYLSKRRGFVIRDGMRAAARWTIAG
jgi:hypothetical protein